MSIGWDLNNRDPRLSYALDFRSHFDQDGVDRGHALVIGGVPFAIDFVCSACAFIPVGATSPGGIAGAGFDPTPDVAGSDSSAFGAGFITVVPIEANYTASENIRDGFESVIEDLNDD